MLPEMGTPPNRFTKDVGELIRKAREEAGLNQQELAVKIHRQRLAVSDMENGKVEFKIWLIPQLSVALDKPLSYFFPDWVKQQLIRDRISDREIELLRIFQEIEDPKLQQVVISQARMLSEYELNKNRK